MSALCDNMPPPFVPWDIDVARINFGANCGPAVFAAVTQREVCRVMQFFPHFPDCRWTNLTQMLRAFAVAGYTTDLHRCASPPRGLALVQFLGPWTEKNFFSRWSLIHTHWVGVEGKWIFDHNAGCWQTLDEWSEGTATELIAMVPRATGWRIKYGVELTRAGKIDLGFPSEFPGLNQCRREAPSQKL
jgi:hypothetical protein